MTLPIVFGPNAKPDSGSLLGQWNELVELGRRQLNSLATGALIVVTALVLLALRTHSDIHSAVLVLLATTAGLSSMSAP
jgi:hypothetical protein